MRRGPPERRHGKQPWFLHDPDQSLLALAGLYELWPDPDKTDGDPERWLWSMTILTTQATDAAGHIHDRSPVIVPADLLDSWLDPHLTDTRQVRDLLATMPPPVLDPYPVSKAVNRVGTNRPDCSSRSPCDRARRPSLGRTRTADRVDRRSGGRPRPQPGARHPRNRTRPVVHLSGDGRAHPRTGQHHSARTARQRATAIAVRRPPPVPPRSHPVCATDSAAASSWEEQDPHRRSVTEEVVRWVRGSRGQRCDWVSRRLRAPGRTCSVVAGRSAPGSS